MPLPPGLPPRGPQPQSNLSEFRVSPTCPLTELEAASGRVSVIHWQTLRLPTQLTCVLELRHTPTLTYRCAAQDTKLPGSLTCRPLSSLLLTHAFKVHSQQSNKNDSLKPKVKVPVTCLLKPANRFRLRVKIKALVLSSSSITSLSSSLIIQPLRCSAPTTLATVLCLRFKAVPTSGSCI